MLVARLESCTGSQLRPDFPPETKREETMEFNENSSDRGGAPLATIRTAQGGDRQAFGRLVEQYQGVVYATVWRKLGNHAEAQELCQDVFCHAMRKIGGSRSPLLRRLVAGDCASHGDQSLDAAAAAGRRHGR